MKATPLLILVDDDAVDQEVFRRALAAEAVVADLTVIGSGRDAATRIKQALAAKGAARGALVLLDLNMPGANGFEVLSALRSDPAAQLVPVVILTTSADINDIARAYSTGANSFIVKPAAFQELRRAVRVIIDYWFSIVVSATASELYRAR